MWKEKPHPNDVHPWILKFYCLHRIMVLTTKLRTVMIFLTLSCMALLRMYECLLLLCIKLVTERFGPCMFIIAFTTIFACFSCGNKSKEMCIEFVFSILLVSVRHCKQSSLFCIRKCYTVFIECTVFLL